MEFLDTTTFIDSQASQSSSIITAPSSSVITTASVFSKLQLVETEVHQLLSKSSVPIASAAHRMPLRPGRDISFQAAHWPGKNGLQTKTGQARLLHDLANIELQAVELGLRTLHEFTDTPVEFREELARITLQEASHLELCLSGLEDLGHEWGDWHIQTALWDATSAEDSLIDRILIVHCYLEGSGLDAGDILLNRLGGVANKKIAAIVGKIVRDEIGHVDFGRRWFQHYCAEAGINSKVHLRERLNHLSATLPARGAKVSRELRAQSGYDADEIEIFEEFQALKVEQSRKN
ncbi:MAG: DUF455 family protein [Bdellovibrionota bacterium]